MSRRRGFHCDPHIFSNPFFATFVFAHNFSHGLWEGALARDAVCPQQRLRRGLKPPPTATNRHLCIEWNSHVENHCFRYSRFQLGLRIPCAGEGTSIGIHTSFETLFRKHSYFRAQRFSWAVGGGFSPRRGVPTATAASRAKAPSHSHELTSVH